MLPFKLPVGLAQDALRQGMTIGAKVTIRGERMYDFLDRLINVALPRIKDFHGVPRESFDGRLHNGRRRMSSQWRERKRPVCLERRYEFGGYHSLRDYLDQAAELSERESLYPDMGFGRDYLNVTIHADEGADALTEKQREFAELLDGLYAEHTAS